MEDSPTANERTYDYYLEVTSRLIDEAEEQIEYWNRVRYDLNKAKTKRLEGEITDGEIKEILNRVSRYRGV